MKRHLVIVFAVTILSLTSAFAQNSTQSNTNLPRRIYTKVPWAVGFGMEGTVTNVIVVDERIHFQLTGWFWFHQYPWGGTNQQIVKVDCKRGISATVNQPDSFVAETSDWRSGAAMRGKGDLLKILKTAGDRGTSVRFELMKPKMDFGTNGFTLVGADVFRVTDANLR